jgi:hypothetical protein
VTNEVFCHVVSQEVRAEDCQRSIVEALIWVGGDIDEGSGEGIEREPLR